MATLGMRLKMKVTKRRRRSVIWGLKCVGQCPIWRDIARVYRSVSQAEGEGKYCTRLQCLAILDTDPGNERFITHFFVHCCLPNDWPYIRGAF